MSIEDSTVKLSRVANALVDVDFLRESRDLPLPKVRTAPTV